MSEMVERVARAIFDADQQRWPKFTHRKMDDMDEATGVVARYRGLARAAIEAMREPTQEMVEAVGCQWGPAYEDDYEKLIDAALK